MTDDLLSDRVTEIFQELHFSMREDHLFVVGQAGVREDLVKRRQNVTVPLRTVLQHYVDQLQHQLRVFLQVRKTGNRLQNFQLRILKSAKLQNFSNCSNTAMD